MTTTENSVRCPSCGVGNMPGHRFCNACGALLADAPTCRSCGTALPAGSKFCTTCGTSVAPKPEVPEGPGYVVDGEWHRAPGEIVRKVPSDALRSAFGRLVPGLDWQSYLQGTLAGKVVDLLLSKSIRIPMGSVGVVTKDGVVVKILPPGEQTTPGFLKDLASSDIAGAAAGTVERWLGGDKVALYLVDRRPVPVSFPIEVGMATGTHTVAATALVSIGGHRDQLGAFLNDVVADRDTLATEDLYVRFRAEIERAVSEALSARPRDLPAAEKVARDSLRARFTARTGLGFDLTLAPRHTVHRLDLVLTTVEAAAAACTKCGAEVRGGAKFCTSCGTAQQVVDPGDVIATKDGASIDVDLVLSVQADKAPTPPTGLLRATAARWLREHTWAEVSGEEGLAGLEAALVEAGGDALGALGFRLIALEVVDVRSRGEQWALGARAAMEQARTEQRIGREWLAVRDDEVALEALASASALKGERVRRDATFSARAAALEDAKRTAALEAGERAVARERAEGVHGDTMAADAREHARVAAGAANRGALKMGEARLGSETTRLAADDKAYEEQRRREARLAELTAMAELEGTIAEREQKHKLATMETLKGQSEGQMIAMQAATLAGQEHGGAFAEALGKIADGEAARRERERADAAAKQSAQAITDLAMAAIEANAKVAAAKAGAPATPTSCPTCGLVLAPGAKFCGGCGTGLV